jgi:hypothetical protein
MTQVSLSYQLDLDEHSIWITATPSQIAKSSILYVQELGDFIAGKNYYNPQSESPSYLIKYCISGEGLLIMKAAVTRSNRGNYSGLTAKSRNITGRLQKGELAHPVGALLRADRAGVLRAVPCAKRWQRAHEY